MYAKMTKSLGTGREERLLWAMLHYLLLAQADLALPPGRQGHSV